MAGNKGKGHVTDKVIGGWPKLTREEYIKRVEDDIKENGATKTQLRYLDAMKEMDKKKASKRKR